MNSSGYWQHLSQEEIFFLIVAAVFFCGGVLLILFLFASRIVKNYNQKKTTALQRIFQQPLNSIVMSEEHEMPEASYKFHLQQLASSLGNSTFAKEVIIRQMIRIKKTISGSSSKRLDRLYRELQLDKFSLARLSSVKWKARAQGLRELTEMNYYDRSLFSRLQSRGNDKTLNEEIIMATVRLDEKDPFSFLENYEGKLSQWMQVNIHHFLLMRDKRSLPKFSQWLGNKNEQVTRFALNMAKQFQQIDAIPSIVKLLDNSKSETIVAALDALTHLNAFQATDVVTRIADRWWTDEVVSKSIIRFLGAAAHEEKHFAVASRYLEHTSHAVRFEAVKVLYKLGEEGRKILSMNNKDGLEALIRHAEDPFLQ